MMQKYYLYKYTPKPLFNGKSICFIFKNKIMQTKGYVTFSKNYATKPKENIHP